jgi:hypothetical protein
METAHSIWEVVEDGLPFKGVDQFGKPSMLFEISEDTDDGTFPTVAGWKKYINKLDSDGASFFLNRLTRKKDKTQIEYYGGVTIIREKEWSDEAIIEFKEPITVVFGTVGDTEITAKVTRLKGEFDLDFFFKKSGRQQEMANGFEIWFKVNEYLG